VGGATFDETRTLGGAAAGQVRGSCATPRSVSLLRAAPLPPGQHATAPVRQLPSLATKRREMLAGQLQTTDSKLLLLILRLQ